MYFRNDKRINNGDVLNKTILQDKVKCDILSLEDRMKC